MAAALLTNTPALPEEGEVSKQLTSILKELQAIRALLDKNNGGPQRQVPSIKVNVSNEPFAGSPKAQIAIVEFTDYQCPFCKHFSENTYKELFDNYVQNGMIRFYIINLPLESHREAVIAAQSATCSADQRNSGKCTSACRNILSI